MVILAMGIFAQGGYNRRGQMLLILGTVLLAGLLLTRRTESSARLSPRVATASLALMVWLVFVGVVTDSLRASIGAVGLVIACTVAYATARRMNSTDRAGALVGLVGVGVVVAAMGWAGVAFRVDPWAVATPSTWRASAPLTYANATAAVICLLLLVSLSLRVERPGSRVGSAATAVLVVGLLATGSRGGWVAAVVGVCVVAALCGVRRTFAVAIVPLVGGAIGFIGLVPSMFGTSARPTWAALTLVAGVTLAYLMPEFPRRFHAPLLIGLVAALGTIAFLYLATDHLDLLRSRWHMSNGDRGRAWSAAIDIIADKPIVGAGFDQPDLYFPIGDQMYRMKYVHNEFLQTATHIGLVGLTFVAWFFHAIVRDTRHGGSRKIAPLTAAVFAGLISQSAFDFLWHFPAIPILTFALAGLAAGASDLTNHPLLRRQHT